MPYRVAAAPVPDPPPAPKAPKKPHGPSFRVVGYAFRVALLVLVASLVDIPAEVLISGSYVFFLLWLAAGAPTRRALQTS